VEAEILSEAGRIEDNPSRLAAIDERLGSIYSLMQKHGAESSDGLMALQREFAAKLDRISGCGEEIVALEAAIGRIREDATAEAAKITAARRKAAATLSDGVEKILDRLGIPAARFVCDITPLPDLSPSGADEIRFLFSANRNVAPQPLEKIASGGEISRVMLALKSLVARSAMLPTIIFDEIDTGVSGRIADAMGEIITELAQSMQVVNITHLPQVASKGDTHFLVYKEETPAGTQSAIKLLPPPDRITEIAKMLSGSQITPAALTQARTLLGMG
jgi:DNA repair protein RecN (Recombination protein N)